MGYEAGEAWAPMATRVDLVVEAGPAQALRRGSGGRFLPSQPLPRGTRYRFSLDGGPPLADPRSHRQPQGVHGPSEVVDHAAFSWTDWAWKGFDLRSAVLYEVHVGTFGDGTFQGVADRLGEIAALGVDALELLPVASFDGDRGWGYDGVLLFSVHEPYGGPEGLKALVDACHAHGLGVVLDVVYNHLGPSGNVLERFGPYLTDRHCTPWGDAVNFDGPDAAEVRRFVLDNARHWVEHYHVDGFRLDATHAIVDESRPHILDELATEMAGESAWRGRRIWLIAEHEEVDERLVLPPGRGGAGLDAVWNDPVHHALHALLTGERDGYYERWGSMAALARVLAERTPADRYVTFSQNHDQIGNRALGERLCHLVGTDLALVAAALVLLSPGLPLLFMGEEWAASTPFPYFCGERSADLDAAVREGRKREFAAFGWTDVPDPVSAATARSARLRWAERDEGDHARVLGWYANLMELRRSRPELGNDRPAVVSFDEAGRWLLMGRGHLEVVANLGNTAVDVALTARAGAGRQVLAASLPAVVGATSVHLPARSVAVLGPA